MTIFDTSDLAFAIQCSRILKLTILLNNQQGSAKEPQLPVSNDIVYLDDVVFSSIYHVCEALSITLHSDLCCETRAACNTRQSDSLA